MHYLKMAEAGCINFDSFKHHGTVTITQVALPAQQDFSSVAQTADNGLVNCDNNKPWKLIRILLFCLLLLDQSNSVNSSPNACSNSDTTEPSNYVTSVDKQPPIFYVNSALTNLNNVSSIMKNVASNKPASSHNREWSLHFNWTLIYDDRPNDDKHRKKRSVDNITVNSDNSANNTITSPFSNSTATTQTPFILYIPGFYGAPCINRALAYLSAHPGAFAPIDAACACVGNCPPPLAPNPDAANFVKASTISTSQVLDRLKNSAPYVAVTAIIVIVSLAGNAMVLASFIIKWLPTTETNICMASQCIADLLITSFSPSIRVISTIYGLWIGGEVTCRLTYGIRDVSFVASSLTMAIVGIERFVVICHPLKARSLVINKRTVNALIAAWMCAIGIGVWRCFNVSYNRTTTHCIAWPAISTSSTAFFIVRLTGIYILPLIVLAFCYICSCVSLKISLNKAHRLRNAAAPRAAGTSSSQSNSEKETSGIIARLKVIYLLIAVLVCFVICWSPILMIETWIAVWPYVPSINGNVVDTIYLLSFASAAINPILYGLFSQPIRACYTRILCCYALRNVALTLSEMLTHHTSSIRGHTVSYTRHNAGFRDTRESHTNTSSVEQNEELPLTEVTQRMQLKE